MRGFGFFSILYIFEANARLVDKELDVLWALVRGFGVNRDAANANGLNELANSKLSRSSEECKLGQNPAGMTYVNVYQ